MEYQRGRAEYFEQLVLAKTGVVKDDLGVEELIEFPTLHRMSTLSSLRRNATAIAAKRKEEKPGSLTEAEKKFEEAISER